MFQLSTSAIFAIIFAILHNDVFTNGVRLQMHRIHRNNHPATLARGLSSSQNSGQGSQTPIFDYHDNSYTVKVTAGTPPREFNVIMDTGSVDFWLYNSICSSEVCQHKYNKFGASTTFVPCKDENSDNKTFSITYGAGTVNGVFGKDTIMFGGLDETNGIKVPKATIGLVNSADVNDRPEMDGILGLGFTENSALREIPPLNEAVKRGLTNGIFTISVATDGPTAQGESGGVLTLGEYDNKNCEANTLPRWVPIVPARWWLFEIQEIDYGMNEFTVDQPQKAVIDTGAPTIGGPPELVQKLYDQIGVIKIQKNKEGEDVALIPCDFPLKPIVLKINGQEFALTKETLIVPAETANQNECKLTIEPADFQQNFDWLLGDPFYQQFCVIHDLTNRRVAFVPNKQKKATAGIQ